MAQAPNNNPDLLYLKSREQLLQYEDARLNSLLQAVANFYTTSNDQSIWGNFLRGLAIELSKLDYDYSYDLVNKDPSLLTPADIRRRWAAPLYLSGNWPSQNQFDLAFKLMLVELIAAYAMGTTVDAIQAVIFAYTGINIVVEQLYQKIGDGVYDQSDRNSITVSVSVGGAGSNPLTTVTTLAQLQVIVQSLYNAIALATPAHVGIEFTTVFGETEDLECMLSPSTLTQQQYVTEVTEIQSFYSLSGWLPINPALFWIANTTYLPGSVVLVPTVPLVPASGSFQLVTAITGDGETGPGPGQPTWNPASEGTVVDHQVTWTNISPAVTSTSVSANVVTVNLSFYAPLVIGSTVTLRNLGVSTFLNGVPLVVTSITGASITASFIHANYSAAETQGFATYALPTPINNIQYQALTAQWKALYQQQYTNSNCTSAGISDTLRIFVQQVEQPPLNDMLVIAPVLDPTHARTTIAAWGDTFPLQLTPAQWATLPAIFLDIRSAVANGANAIYTYVPTTQFLHEDELVTITGFANPAFNVTARVHDVVNTVAQLLQVTLSPTTATITETSVMTDTVTVTALNDFAAGMTVTFSGLTTATFLNGQSLVITSAGPTSFTVTFSHANYATSSDTGSALAPNVLTFTAPNTFVAGQMVTFSGSPATFLNGKTVSVLSANANSFTAVLPADTATVTSVRVLGNVLTILAPNDFVSGADVIFSGLVNASFLNGQTVTLLTATPSQFTAAFTHVNYGPALDAGTATAELVAYGTVEVSGQAEVSSFSIPLAQTIALQVPSPSVDNGVVSPVPQAAYYLSGGVYVLGQAPVQNSGAGIGESWVPSGTVFQGQIVVDSNGYTQVALNAGTSQATNPAWSEALNVSTPDGNVQWRNVGRDTFVIPQRWIAIWNLNAPGPRAGAYDFSVWTGEVGNWDASQPYGLLAPRLDQVWEISGGDQDFIFGLN